MGLRLARLDSRSLVRVSGPDWRPFLHNLLTHDMLGLAAGEIRFTGLLTPQGRILHDVFVHAGEDEAILDVAADGRDDLLKRLTLYRLRAKVALEPVEGALSAVFHPAHPDESRDPDSSLAGERSLGPGFRRGERVGSAPLDPRLPELGWRFAVEPLSIDAEPVTEADYDRHRLSLGVPDPARDRTANTYPIEANWDLLNGVDFMKGCFIGQETTSRMKRRGQIKTRILPIAFDGPPPPFGAELLAGGLRAGEVLTGAEGRAMAVLRLDRIEGAELTVDGRAAKVVRPTWMPG